jgi:hypothetical protein
MQGDNKVPVSLSNGDAQSQRIALDVGIANASQEPAHYCHIELLFDAGFFPCCAGMEKKDNLFYKIEEVFLPIVSYALNWGVPAKMPIFYGVLFSITSGRVTIRISSDHIDLDRDFFIDWTVRAPRMQEKRGRYTLHLSDRTLTLSPAP